MPSTGWYTINKKDMSEMADLCDQVSDHATEAVDALAQYEDADDKYMREDARESFGQSVGDLLATADELRERANKFEEGE